MAGAGRCPLCSATRQLGLPGTVLVGLQEGLAQHAATMVFWPFGTCANALRIQCTDGPTPTP